MGQQAAGAFRFMNLTPLARAAGIQTVGGAGHRHLVRERTVAAATRRRS